MNEIIISILLVLGSLFIMIAAIGLLRFKDFFGRIHAATKATSFGILLLLIAVMIYFDSWSITLKSLLIIIFIYLTAPLAAHSIAKSFDKEKRDMN